MCQHVGMAFSRMLPEARAFADLPSLSSNSIHETKTNYIGHQVRGTSEFQGIKLASERASGRAVQNGKYIADAAPY
jgi:hypothetical protein